MRLSRYFLRRRWDEERADEIKAHLAHEIDDNLERRNDRGRGASACVHSIGKSDQNSRADLDDE